MKNGAYYGIDFGTTNTSVYMYCYEEGKGSLESGYGTDGSDIAPFSSCMAIPLSGNGGIRFGREVKEKINEYSESCRIITSFKSLLGTSEEIAVNGIRYDGRKLAALFLEYVRKTVIAERQDFKEAVFSVPVDFSAAARTDLLEAAKAAGITVKGFVSESSAAYISKAREMRECSKVMVIDFGGGTLDMSILRLTHDQVHEEAVYGIKFGGDDIDRELAERLMPKIYPGYSFEWLESRKKDKLMNEIERMKIAFADIDCDEYTVTLGEGVRPVTIDYETFYGIVTPLITSKAFNAVIKAMEKADVSQESIDAVILAGGSSKLRPFGDIILSMFGEDKCVFDDKRYQWMVAKGAAVTSAIDCEFRLSDDICVLLSDGETYPVLKKDINKVGDRSGTLSFSLTSDDHDAHFIFTDSAGKNRYAVISVKAKGFIDEKLEMYIEIGMDQVARVVIKNSCIGDDYKEEQEINKLRFYYDLSGMGDNKNDHI